VICVRQCLSVSEEGDGVPGATTNAGHTAANGNTPAKAHQSPRPTGDQEVMRRYINAQYGEGYCSTCLAAVLLPQDD
jgi:hypothetical protein